MCRCRRHHLYYHPRHRQNRIKSFEEEAPPCSIFGGKRREMDNESRIKRIAVVGSGIGGLAFAACMKHMHTGVEEVVVFDSHDDTLSFNLGGALGLSGGAAVLERIGCMEELRKRSCAVKRILATYHDHKIMELDLVSMLSSMCSTILAKDNSQPMIYTTRWSELRKIMHDFTFARRDEVEEKSFTYANVVRKAIQDDGGTSREDSCIQRRLGEVPETNISCKQEKKLHRIEERPETGKIKLHFHDGSMEDNFDLVIGADGVKSTVRQFTALPNANMLSMLPFGTMLPLAKGNFYTGVRVLQCITPPRSGKHDERDQPIDGGDDFKDQGYEDRKEDALDRTTREIVNRLQDDSRGLLHQRCGKGCNVLTMNIGNGENERFVLVVIYGEREDIKSQYGTNEEWLPEHYYHNKVKKLLHDGGFGYASELFAVVDAANKPGGRIFDVGVFDHLFPLRTWCSESGRIILVGDSAHTMSPFLGQGANQAIQDAYCLASLIYNYNHGLSLHIADRLARLAEDIFPRFPLLNFVMNLAIRLSRLLFNRLNLRVSKPSRLQIMARDYEVSRKFHATAITIGSRFMGRIASLKGVMGFIIKIMFFRFIAVTGLAKVLYLAPMRPAV